nr:MarC family protein [Methylogaea oryzae]
MELLHDAAKLLLPLVIIMDPLGNLTFFLLFTQDQDDPTRRRTALIAAAGAGAILLLFSFSGEALLQFFAIGLPAFQLSGGLILLIHALQMLHLIPQGIKTTSEEQEEASPRKTSAWCPWQRPCWPALAPSPPCWYGANRRRNSTIWYY